MKVGNKPGVTKQKQWLRLASNIELLDTPGVLWPRLDNEEVALNLAYTGTIKSDVLDEPEIAYNLTKLMLNEYKENLLSRYNLNEEVVEKMLNNKELQENERIVEVMNYIGEKRGAILRGNEIDLNKTSRIILDDFRSGNLGRITLERAK
jgi:ribosome biogenesis GTPase A